MARKRLGDAAPGSVATVLVPAVRAGRRTPRPLNATVSAQMQRMPRSSTGPELALRRALHRLGMRFRIGGNGLPGRPDIVFTKAKLAVFVDGCFWHRCTQHGTLPKNNADWWVAKLDRNVARDREKDAALDGLGWLAVHVWEHEEPQSAAVRILELWTLHRNAKRPARLSPQDLAR
jgi:DNA mismatch endonuclease, patch repair protein